MTMKGASATNDDQASRWNGVAAQAWIESQDVVEQLFKPFEDLMVEAAAARSPRRVLDVGCGTGGTTIAVARTLGSGATCLGVDISEPMIGAARGRAEREHVPASFICADAQVYAFEPASFDLIQSRFGVMFFADPVQAFANLRRASREGAELRVIPWRSADENPFMTAAERAAAPLLPHMPAREPNAPGQFAFADPQRVRAILDASGWTGIDIQPLDVICTMPAPALDNYLTRFGPVGRALDGADDRTRTQILQAIRPAFDRYVDGTDVRFTAACWMVSAR